MTDAQTLRDRLDKLRRLRASGVSRTRFGNDDVEYRTDAEFASAIADLERQIAETEGRPSVSFVNFRTNRGW